MNLLSVVVASLEEGFINVEYLAGTDDLEIGVLAVPAETDATVLSRFELSSLICG